VPKLLLADDSPTTQKVVRLTFADEGVDVVTAEDGDTALELIAKHRPDIILADVNMPGLNGYEVCEKIRQLDESRATPVVLLVGSFEPFDSSEARRVGANDYLTKPFSSIRRLVATVTALLDNPQKAEPGDLDLATQLSTNNAAPGEVDLVSTRDIDTLYNKSVAETAELPREIVTETIASKTNEPVSEGSQSFSQAKKFGDVAMDDELIDTVRLTAEGQTFSGSEPTSASETVEGGFGGVDTGAATALAATPSTAPEPSPVSNTSVQSEADVASVYGPANMSEPQKAEIAEPISPGLQSVQPRTPTVTKEFSMEAQHDESYFEPLKGVADEEAETRPSAPPTPWDTVAQPSTGSFDLDDTNLLELPTGGYAGRISSSEMYEPLSTASADDISPELVERIARIAALQISEQLIREIAERVVPGLVEQAIERRTIKEVNG
jgi:CheY-like chemotaxis protein